MKTLLTVCLLACALSGVSPAATIWQENFDSYADGVTNGTAGKWTADSSACAFDGDDHFEVRGQRMQGNDLDGEAVWSSEIISISSLSSISVSVDISDNSSGLEAADYLHLYYKVDGGAETLFATNGDNSDDFGTLTASQSGLTGNTLQLVIRMLNNANSEIISFDNILVENAAVPSNTPPVLAPIGNQSVTVSNALNFSVTATDADNDSVILSASNLPPGAAFNTVTNAGTVSNTFNWASATPVGVYTSTFYAADGTTNDFEQVIITVTNAPVVPVNNPPVLTAIGNQSVTVSNTLSFTVTATDADNDLITLSASNVPTGAVFSSSASMGSVTGTFSWVSAAPTGSYSTTFYANDGTTNTSESITITVTNPPIALTGPVWSVTYNLPQQSGTAYPDQFRIRDALLARINALQSGNSASLSTFTFSAEEGAGAIMNAMDAALDRGAAIRFIADGGIQIGTVYGGTNSLLDLSTRSTNPLTLKVDGSTSGIMHDKLGLFDYGGSNQWVFVASWNFTQAASADQWNIALEARSPELYAIYTNETAEFLAGRFHDDPAKSHAHDGATFALDGSWGTNFVRFAPYPDATQGGNNAERDITNLIAQAQGEIVFALNKLNREPIRDALVAAADRGVIIKGVMPKSDTDPGNVSDDIYSYLTNAANYATTNIVQMLPAYAKSDYSALDTGESDLIHAKYMVIDPQSTNAVVIHGSANWTSEALVNDNDNDENTLFLCHNEIAAEFFENFQRITGTGAFSEGNSTLVSWDFQDSNQVADGGIAANATQTVVRIPAPSSYTYTGDALSSSGWQSGTGTKYWETFFSTEEHNDIKVSSVQTASGTGPSDFKLQYKIGAGGTYSNIPDATVQVVESTGKGLLTRISLPAACDNQTNVFLRWIMTSDIAARRYDNVQSGGRGSIDDIVITGTAYDQPPLLDSIGNKTVFEGETLSFSVTASDPIDGDAITLSASNLPSGAVYSAGTFTWSNATPSGVYTSTFYAVDKDGADSETITITVIEKPLLMLTEIADPAGTGGGDCRFVELYNAGSSSIILDGGLWFLSKQVNGGVTWTDTPLVGTLPAGETLVIAYDATEFQTAYGFAPDQTSSAINGTGDDAYFLYYGGDHSTGVLIDIYGAFDTDGSGEAWEYTDSRAVRKTSVSQPNTVWTAAEWVVVDGATTNEMEPGIRGSLPQFQNLTDQFVLLEQSLSFDVTAADPINETPISITASNLPSGATFDGNTFSWVSAVPIGTYNVTFTATNTDGQTTQSISITVLEKPLLLISEIADPAGDGSDAYRFVELYNAGTNAIDLATNSWTLSRQNNGSDWTDISLTGTVVSADGTYVIAKGTDFTTAYGVTPDQLDSGVDGNGNDVYALYYGGDHTDGTLIDIYGQIDTDGSDTAWDYTDSRAVRKNSILQPNQTWTASEWTITPEATTNAMTPGVHGPTPEFQGLEDQFVILGDDLNLPVTAVNTVRTDTITLSATNLPIGAIFPTNTSANSVTSTLNWNNPTAGVYTVTFLAKGGSGTQTKSIDITVSSTTQIDGYFYGWESDTIVKLRNGQFWRKTSGTGYTADPRQRNPDVTLTNAFGTYRMVVDGVPTYKTVEQIEIIESMVTNVFSGLYNGNIYQLADGTTWKQTSWENISSAADPITAWRWEEGGKTYLRFIDRDDVVIGTAEVISSSAPASSAIISRIDGYFRGWKNKRIFILQNGQFWQQIVAKNSTEALYNPKATVTNHLGTGTFRLIVEGAQPPGYVEVEQVSGITRTRIDGTFYGFGKDGIYAMQDGSWWRQTSFDSSASIRPNPEVLIWNDGGTDIIQLTDEGLSVEAEQLNVLAESTVSNAFSGLHYANIYELANTQDWMQVSFENINHSETAPAAVVFVDSGSRKLLLRDSSDREIGMCTVENPWADNDGDQIPNASELISGTSLYDQNDFFMVNDIHQDGLGRAVLSWAPVSGRIYTIEWTASLGSPFQTLETDITWPQNSWTDTINAAHSGGFYRITVRLAD